MTIPPGDSNSGIVSTTNPDTSASTSQPPTPLSEMAALFWLSMALRMLTSHSDEVGGGLRGDFEDVEGMGMSWSSDSSTDLCILKGRNEQG